MNLKEFLKSVPDPAAREAFAARCGTTLGHMRHVISGRRPCATDLAVCVERESKGRVTRQELRTDWADHWPELIAGRQPRRTHAMADQGA